VSIGSFNGLNTALRGLLANQRALDVTSHNIANAETPGFSRQEAVLATAPSLHLSSGAVVGGLGAHVGQGVDVLTYRRLRDDFLDAQWRGQNMSLGAQDASAQRLGQVEAVLKEPTDAGLGNLLDKFFGAWQDLANHPESGAAKSAVLGRAQALVTAFGTLDRDLGAVAADATTEVAETLSAQGPVAQAATELAKLNGAIRTATQAGIAPNDLLDRRDLLIDQLSSYGQVSVTPDTAAGNDGMVIIGFGGATTPLVDGTTATVPTPADLSNAGGRLGALQSIAGTTVPGYRSALDGLASAVAGAVNGAHPTPIFSGGSAATLAVVAGPGSIVAGAGPAGDTTVASAIAGMRNSADPSLGGMSITQSYADLVRRVGSDVSDAEIGQRTQRAVVSNLTERRQSVAGVSMDEEMTNMVRFQRGYQAAARALTTIDETLDTLINRTGRVGL
jgi:flagellar hook-associated protein 1 FlgK